MWIAWLKTNLGWHGGSCGFKALRGLLGVKGVRRQLAQVWPEKHSIRAKVLRRFVSMMPSDIYYSKAM